ncbi:hypothetical protein FQN53_002068 [Emmonsiellopsis sp. PD_33]|nr:hypothetical protein FQN53_002068 [Emmonsiellopsis sp. PD_33]
MSGYYVGPFGRILPVPEDSSALEDAQDDASLPKRLTNYHLPPPRKPVALQFGSDTTLGPPESIDSSDSAMNRVPSQDNGSRHQPQDTLPSVSQILTPASFPGTPSPSYPYAGRGNSPLNSAGTHRSPIGETYDRTTQQAGYSNHGLVSDARTGSVPESIDTSYGHKQYTSYNRDQLPPLSQVGLDPASLRAQHFREYARNSSDAPLARYHQGQLPYLRELSNSEISSASNPSSFTGETSLRSGSPTGQNQLRVAHVVDERVIEGEGLCYIYSDGSHCPKLIDGELVNSNWGITKAARSSADPMGHDLSSISHGQSAAYVASGYSNSGMSLGGIVDMSPTPGRSQDPGPLMHEAAGRGPGFDRPLKRRRRASTNPIGAAGEDSKPEKDRARASDSYGMSDILSEMAAMDMHDPTLSEWETDPYQTDPESTMHYVDLYFRSDWYENQKWATMPYFENGIIPADPSLPEERGALDPMAFLVEISAVWGDVLENAYRSSYISSANYPKHFEEFYESTIKRADKWIASLPSYFTYSAGNMQRSIQAGQTDVFASVHILYHATMMRLNRHTRCDDIPEAITQRNARRSHYHCVEILRIALDLRHLLDTNQTEGPTTPSAAPRNTFSTPLTGNAIISATDVLSAAGYMRDAPYYLTLINAGLDLITEVAKFWHTAREQLRVMQPRVARITEAINTHAKRGGDKLGFAVEGRALDVILIDRVMPTDERGSSPGHGNNPAAAKRGDLVYALSREAYFHALGFTDISVERGDVLWIPCPDDTS